MKEIDLSKLFWSKTRVKILEKFFLEFESGKNDWFHMRWLSRDLWEQINSIKRELDNLEALSILKSKEEAKKKIFYLNKNFFLIEEFRNIFLKSYNPYENIKNFFKNEKNLELVIIHKELLKNPKLTTKNIVDIFMIWEIDKIKFNNFLARIFFNRKIKYAIISKKDYKERCKYNDKLIFNIINQEWNLFLIDKLWVKKSQNTKNLED